jgi:hypothetical protein
MSQELRDKFVCYIGNKLDSYPPLKRIIGVPYRWGWQFKLKIKHFKLEDTTIDLNKTYMVNPEDIIYAAKRGFSITKDKGRVIGGNWDLPENRKLFEELDVYQAFYHHFVNDKKWSETDFYHRVLGEISEGKVKWGCKSKADLDMRFKKLDELYHSIKDKGYKTQKELKPRALSGEDEVTVSIDRTGKLLFTNGRHRLSIAMILGLKEIPVKITVRYSGWMNFRNQILAYTKDQHDGKVYQPLTHPDLVDIPSVYGDYRFEIIKSHLSIKQGTLLDIGSNWGYFCHKFEEEGFHCYAVENNPVDLYFLRKLKKAENRTFEIIDKSIFEYREKFNFDVVLALNILHHFLKKKDSYFKLIELLNRLKMSELYFQTHRADENQMRDAYKNYSPEEFVDFILENSCLDEAKLIGEENGRLIYKLYRK